MSHSTILDLGDHHQSGLPAALRQRSLAVGIALGGLVALLLVAGAFARPHFFPSDNDAAVIRIPLDQQQFLVSLNVDDKQGLLAEGGSAQERNAAIPIAGLPVERGGEFNLVGGAYPTALRCLTQAVYYEAAVEPLTGRRAVAQVILNRMRHPAYPHSICGVVYQGSERRTGCQFSFTCDGSLLRTPSAGAWAQAEKVAREALAGHVEPSVGTATHYHADYVLPKWAFQLGKIAQIGRHIFYRFNGGWGRASSLRQAYSGHEFIPSLNFAALRERLQGGGPTSLAAHEFVPGLTVPPAVTDRHAANDIGGRIDMTKEWRPSIPDPVQASSRYRAALGEPAERNATSVAAGGVNAVPAPATPIAPAVQTAPAVHEVAAR
jgi:hypothetical protein